MNKAMKNKILLFACSLLLVVLLICACAQKGDRAPDTSDSTTGNTDVTNISTDDNDMQKRPDNTEKRPTDSKPNDTKPGSDTNKPDDVTSEDTTIDYSKYDGYNEADSEYSKRY